MKHSSCTKNDGFPEVTSFCSWISLAAHAACPLQPAVSPSSRPVISMALLPDPPHTALLWLTGKIGLLVS